MGETYTPFTWVDGAGLTEITAARLNNIEQGVESMDDRVAAVELGSGIHPVAGVYYANGYPGVYPNQSTDSTTGLNNLFAAVPSGSTIVLSGIYRINGVLNAPADECRIRGQGEATILDFKPSSGSTMLTLTDKHRIKFLDVAFLLPATTAGAGSTLIALSNTFRCSFTRCVFQGQHTSAGDAYGVTTGHVGVRLTGNAGDNLFIDCSFNNLGVGIHTDCVDNGVMGGAFSSCYVGVYGFGASQSAMSLQGYIDFVSFDDEPGLVSRNIWVPHTANDWWISDCWFEGADTAIEFGDGGGTGPSLLSITNCHIAANTTGLKVLGGQCTTLRAIRFSYSNGNTAATSVTINSTYATGGSAIALRSLIPSDPQKSGGNGQDLVSSVFPSGWTYVGNYRTKLSNELIGGSDWVNNAGSKLAGVLSSGALIVDGDTAGLVLKDSTGKYWRVTVSSAGALTVTGLTTTRPTT